MLSDLFLVAAGLGALLLGGDALVTGAVALARRLGLSPLTVGLTVVAFGTSAPELAVSVIAAVAGEPDIAVGNVLGSNAFNALVVVGAAALLAPVVVNRLSLRRDVPVCLLATLATLVAGATGGQLARWEGLVGLALLVGYVTLLTLGTRDGGGEEPGGQDTPGLATAVAAALAGILAAAFGAEPLLLVVGVTMGAMGVQALLFLHSRLRDLTSALVLVPAGLAVLIGGSEMLVSGGSSLAATLGVSDAVIGLTVVAVGTSAPEFATTLVAARRGESDIAVGNALGSNIFNLLGVLGLAAVLHPVGFGTRFLVFDGWVAFAATAVLLPAAMPDRRIRRLGGAVLVALWVAYTGVLIGMEVGRLQVPVP